MEDIKNSDIYFATQPTDKVADYLSKRVENYYDILLTTGLNERYRRAYRAYYGFDMYSNGHVSSRVNSGGDQGELTLVKVNQYRNLVKHLLVMTTAQRPAMDARATNTDYKSQSQTVLANAILEFYMREKRMERKANLAAEGALIFAEEFIEISWDTELGSEVMVGDDGRIIKEGDIKLKTYSPYDVIRDLNHKSFEDTQWYIVREFVNKFDLIAKFPELEEKIRSLSLNNINSEKLLITGLTKNTCDELVPLYRFYHEKTPSVPNGRLVEFLDGNILLTDGDLPYKKVPLIRISAGEIHNTPLGYTDSFDLLGMQEIYDSLHSTVATNQTNFGVSNIMLPKGHGIKVSALGGGLNLLEYDSKVGKPEPLNLTQTPPEIFKYLEMLEGAMQTIYGINSVVRGNPEANLKSGSALALVASQAIQFATGFQQSYTQLLEDLGTTIIQILQSFANTKRIAEISGKSNRTTLKEYTNADLDKVARVTVDVGNPLMKTIAGKVQIADNLLERGMLKTPEEYLTVIQTGKLEPLYESDQKELLLIKKENEMLSDEMSQEPVVVVMTDAHNLHIREHKTVLADPTVRLNPIITQKVLDHISEHLNQLRMGDPALLAMLGEQSIAPPPMPMAEGGQMPSPETGSIQEQAANVQEAQMPINPLSGEQFNNQDGGIPQ